jgi:serine/threonine-protein kinase
MEILSGKYRLDARLGGGGMAEVFAGSTVGAEGFSRQVAIKRVLPGYSDNPQFAQMFVAEAQITSRLQHPNIVSILDFDRDAEQRLFLVMEMVEGRDLDALVSTGPLPIPVIIFVISEALRGLGYAHDLPVGKDVRGVVHRDVSPHNVLLSWEGAVKVSDFGIAKARAASEATASVFIKGKPAYMSPEQANGQALDGRSDLFAVGIMLWEMLVGRRLFSGDDTRSTLAAVLFGQVPRPRGLRPDVPKDLERVVMKLLERDLPARYATAEAAIADLNQCAAAPRDGREALISILAERFPDVAQVRQSRVSGRHASLHGGGPAGASATPTASTFNGRGAQPSLGAVMAARTGTMEPSALIQQPSRPPWATRGGKIAIGLTVGAVVGVLALAIGMGKARHHAGAAAGSDAASAPTVVGDAAPPPVDAAPPAIDAAPPPIDAAPPPPIDAAPPPPIDAAPPLPIDAGVVRPTTPAVSKKFGYLTVTGFPVLTVYVDGKNLGSTPVVKYRLPVGRHGVRLTNPDLAKDERVGVTITEEMLSTIER